MDAVDLDIAIASQRRSCGEMAGTVFRLGDRVIHQEASLCLVGSITKVVNQLLIAEVLIRDGLTARHGHLIKWNLQLQGIRQGSGDRNRLHVRAVQFRPVDKIGVPPDDQIQFGCDFNVLAVTKETTAVDNVSFAIERGEFFSLLGPSGCGKTTLLRMIAGFEIPTSGAIFLDGKDITYDPPYTRDVNMVFQN